MKNPESNISLNVLFSEKMIGFLAGKNPSDFPKLTNMLMALTGSH